MKFQIFNRTFHLPLDFDIPIAITRRWLYFVCLFSTVFFVLLPFSILSYSKLHEALIPANSPRIPLDFTSESTQSITVTGANSRTADYAFDTLVYYHCNINLNVICGDKLKGKLIPVDYSINSDNSTLFKDYFILDCDTTCSHNHNNWWIPYNLRYWVPPIAVNFDRSVDIVLDKFKLPGHVLADKSTHLQLKLKKIPGLIIDNDRSWLNFKIEFLGFRYYIVKYYILSFIVGVFSFWSTNSILCIITSFYVLGSGEEDDSVLTDRKSSFQETRID